MRTGRFPTFDELKAELRATVAAGGNGNQRSAPSLLQVRTRSLTDVASRRFEVAVCLQQRKLQGSMCSVLLQEAALGSFQ
jgi:hypothetical protein